MDKKKATPKSSPNTQIDFNKLCPRHQRLILALLKRPHSTRELIDAIPTNNVSEYVTTLRNRYRLDIPCEDVPYTTIDSRPSTYGLYSLTSSDRKKLAQPLTHDQ